MFDAVLNVFDAADDEGYIDPESLAAVAETAMGTLPDAVREPSRSNRWKRRGRKRYR